VRNWTELSSSLFPDQSPTELVAAPAGQPNGCRVRRATDIARSPAAGSRWRRAALPASLLRLRAPAGGEPSASAAERHTSPPTAELRQQLDCLFADNARRLGDRPDWQKLAAALAWRGRLTIISGGPGTGKTTTVVALLACLLAENPGLRVALAAPTGKAAVHACSRRCASALATCQSNCRRCCRASRTRCIGCSASRRSQAASATTPENPLPIDALVVDEASMLDLALACRLCEAVPPDARLILLGDKDQLSAVEAGAVFSEVSADPTLTAACIAELASLTATPAARIQPPPAITPTPLADCVVWFSESHRFASTSGIGRLAADINAGRGTEACDWLASARRSRRSAGYPTAAPTSKPATRQAIRDGYHPYCRSPLVARTPTRRRRAARCLPPLIASACSVRAARDGPRRPWPSTRSSAGTCSNLRWRAPTAVTGSPWYRRPAGDGPHE
jgi:ATP-dependent exoDNAse (exonuclease V) alpha subunit